MYIHVRREMHVHAGCIGGLLVNTVHFRGHGKCVASPRLSQRGVTGSGQLHGKRSYVLGHEMRMALLYKCIVQ